MARGAAAAAADTPAACLLLLHVASRNSYYSCTRFNSSAARSRSTKILAGKFGWGTNEPVQRAKACSMQAGVELVLTEAVWMDCCMTGLTVRRETLHSGRI
jgi:hypothetical protein